jgi:hypothetical protein
LQLLKPGYSTFGPDRTVELNPSYGRLTLVVQDPGGQDSAPFDDLVVATLEAANSTNSTSYRLLRRLPGGYQTGAYELRNDSGERAVLKRWVGTRPLEQLEQAAATVELARSAGWPTPAWLYWGIGPDGVTYEIQEFVDGHHRKELDEVTLDALLAVNALQADLEPPASNDWSRWVREVVYDAREGILDAVVGYSLGGSRFGSAVDRIRTYAGQVDLPNHDLVSGVFSLENVLFNESGVVGVVDVQALGRGTRAFDLAVLYSRLSSEELQSPTGRRLRATAEAIAGPAVFATCLVAEFLGILHFVIRNNPAVVPSMFDAAAEALEWLERGAGTS